MLGRYGHSTSKDQRAVVGLIWGNSYPNLGGSMDNIASGVEYVSDYTKDAYVTNSFISLSAINTEINNNRPLCIGLTWNSGGGHAVVADGYDAGMVRIIDPWETVATKYYVYTGIRDGATFGTGYGYADSTVRYR